MQITERMLGQNVELKIDGRLDVYWADHLAAAINEQIRHGSHHIRLDLSQVAFLSSAGIGVLVRFYRELKSIGGSFAVSACSPYVLRTLELTHLETLLLARSTADQAGSRSPIEEASEPASTKRIQHAEATYEVYPLARDAKLECLQLGDARLLNHCGFGKEHCRTMQFSDSTFAIGLGALGEQFEDCRDRFGEFIAAGGAIAYLPTDGTNVPDFLLGGGNPLPVQVCYGIACHGTLPQPFSNLIRFEAKDSNAPVALSCLLESFLDLAGAEQIGLVAIAESAGLIGAALRRSPVLTGSEVDAFEFPRIRDWLTFTSEPAHTKSVVLLAGVAFRGDADAVASVIRPFPNSSSSARPIAGHFHAAAFSYRPVQRGQIDLITSIKTLFEGQTLEGVLHLLSDDRPATFARQSLLVRGACWTAPISNITLEAARA